MCRLPWRRQAAVLQATHETLRLPPLSTTDGPAEACDDYGVSDERNAVQLEHAQDNGWKTKLVDVSLLCRHQVCMYGILYACMYECTGVWVYECMGVLVYEFMYVYTYVRMYTCAPVYEYISIWVYQCVSIWVYECMSVLMYVLMYVWTYARKHACTYARMHAWRCRTQGLP